MVKHIVTALVAALVSSSAGFAQDTVLYDFWSPSCPPCRQMEPTVGRLISAGLPVRKINVMGQPEERELARRHRVSLVPCFVMVVDRQEVDRVEGATSYDRLEQMVRRGVGMSNSANRALARTQSPDQLAPPSSSGQPPDSDDDAPHPQSWPASSRTADEVALSARPANKLIDSTVRLRIEDDQGHSWGSGTIIDARSGEALVITCGHIFRDSRGNGKVIVELFQTTSSGPRVVDRVTGQVISYDLKREIGLVGIRPNCSVQFAPVATDSDSIRPNQKVVSIGCDHGSDPTAILTHVTAINRYLGPPNIEAAGAPVEGRSGGGLFDERGALIGICYAADPEGNEGLYTALASIHAELDRLGLTDIYQSPLTASQGSNKASPRRGENSDSPPENSVESLNPTPIIRGQEPMEPVAAEFPVGANTTPRHTQDLAASQSSQSLAASAVPELSPFEQAAWDEVMARANESEVICIIRPKSSEGQSEVLTLNKVSREFVQRLLEHSSRSTTPR